MRHIRTTLSDHCHHYRLLHDDEQPLGYGDVCSLLAEDAGFRRALITSLADVAFDAYRWETPSVTRTTLDQPFEFVVLDAPHLADRQDPRAFAEYFAMNPEAEVVTFANLGGDALLLAPTPRTNAQCYGHLAAFVRLAPEPQRDAFFKQLGVSLQAGINDQRLWLNTEGSGVPWLHVRLDRIPKYYGYAPYAGQ